VRQAPHLPRIAIRVRRSVVGVGPGRDVHAVVVGGRERPPGGSVRIVGESPPAASAASTRARAWSAGTKTPVGLDASLAGVPSWSASAESGESVPIDVE